MSLKLHDILVKRLERVIISLIILLYYFVLFNYYGIYKQQWKISMTISNKS